MTNPSTRPQERATMDSLIRFAVAVDDETVSIMSHQTRTRLDLPRADVPLLIAALQNLDRTASRSESASPCLSL